MLRVALVHFALTLNPPLNTQALSAYTEDLFLNNFLLHTYWNVDVSANGFDCVSVWVIAFKSGIAWTEGGRVVLSKKKIFFFNRLLNVLQCTINVLEQYLFTTTIIIIIIIIWNYRHMEGRRWRLCNELSEIKSTRQRSLVLQ